MFFSLSVVPIHRLHVDCLDHGRWAVACKGCGLITLPPSLTVMFLLAVADVVNGGTNLFANCREGPVDHEFCHQYALHRYLCKPINLLPWTNPCGRCQSSIDEQWTMSITIVMAILFQVCFAVAWLLALH